MSKDILSALPCNPAKNYICPDPSSILRFFSEELQYSRDHHAPYVTCTISRRSAPWITTNMKKAL